MTARRGQIDRDGMIVRAAMASFSCGAKAGAHSCGEEWAQMALATLDSFSCSSRQEAHMACQNRTARLNGMQTQKATPPASLKPAAGAAHTARPAKRHSWPPARPGHAPAVAHRAPRTLPSCVAASCSAAACLACAASSSSALLCLRFFFCRRGSAGKGGGAGAFTGRNAEFVSSCAAKGACAGTPCLGTSGKHCCRHRCKPPKSGKGAVSVVPIREQ